MAAKHSYAELDVTLSRVADEKADAVAEVVAVVRGKEAERTPPEAIRVLNAWYLKGQTVSEGVRAAGASVPLVGGLAAGLSGETLASLDRTMVYLLALADLHGLDLADQERRKTLLMAVLLGDEGAELAAGAISGQGGRWARGLASGLPLAKVGRLARVGGGNPLLAALVAKAVGGGLSVAIAASGEAVRAQAVVLQASRAFGEPPELFPGQAPRATAEPLPASAVYARALARTLHKARQRARESDRD